ncbi:MAG: transcriptional regulator [Proteobacteria bacterium]|nr:transcriptional regulator [Pseudomonadota bacterium]
MARGDQMGRQWKVIQTLISAHHGKTVNELVDELELDCHPRTVYRDLEALQTAGFPIYTETMDGKNLWMIMDSAREKMPIPMTLSELMSLYLARDMLKVLRHTVFYSSLKSLFHKIKTSLPDELLSYLKDLEKNIQIGHRPYKESGELRNTLETINQALKSSHYIYIRYHTMSRNKTSTRTVAPYTIWFFDDSFYMIAYCTLRNAVRIFALDRISDLEVSDQVFEKPDDFNAEDFMKSSFGVFKGSILRVKVLFSAEVAGYIREKRWHASQRITDQENGSIMFEAEVEGSDEIRFWLLSWGSNAQVLEPESLRLSIREEAEKILAQST